MRALLVLLVLAFLFLLIRTRTEFRLDPENLNPFLLGYGILFFSGIVTAEVLRPVLSRLQPALRFAFVIALMALVWLGLDQLQKTGQLAKLLPTEKATEEMGPALQEELSPAWDDIYRTVADVNGQSAAFVIDLASPLVLLQYETAERLGLDPAQKLYRDRVSLGDRKIQVAPVTLERLLLGDLEVTEVKAGIAAPGRLEANILGLSFLARLDRVTLKEKTLQLGQSAR